MALTDKQPSMVSEANAKIPAPGAYTHSNDNPFVRFFNNVLHKNPDNPIANPLSIAEDNEARFKTNELIEQTDEARDAVVLAAGTFAGFTSIAAKGGYSIAQSNDAAQALDNLINAYEKYHTLLETSVPIEIKNPEKTEPDNKSTEIEKPSSSTSGVSALNPVNTTSGDSNDRK